MRRAGDLRDILAIGRSPLDVSGTMLRFSLTQADSLAAIFFNAIPLIFSGLPAALACRANL
ncbi:MAG: hypothetical protein QN183_02770 [Armatimonadota bacterium]|nr:hypothetical protein [Armatimonadota bacterium]MDR7532348.1 hypothetical protein [Armatimonadota bacterium]MDR7535275.1 hypothetical protein [Armatimonadota bacterium]